MTARTLTGTLRMAAFALLIALAAAPAQAKLLGYWSFDDAGTPSGAFDDSHRGNTGTLIGASFTGSGTGHSGAAGDHAIDFGSVNNGWRVQLPTASLGTFDSVSANTAVTVSLWVNGSLSQPTNDVAFGFYNGGNRQFQTHIPWGNQTIYWDTGWGNPGTNRIQKTENDSTKWEGGWNHYAFVRDGNSLNNSKIYQNGSLWHQGTMTTPISIITGAAIGSKADGGDSYNGLIDDVAVWDEALSGPDINNLSTGAASPADYASPLNHYAQVVLADNPFAYYRFEPDTGSNGSTLTDWSGNGRHGSYNNNVAIEVDWAYGIGGTSAHFNGANNRAAGTTAQPTAAVTVEAWVKSDTAVWNDTGPLVSKRDAFILHPRNATTELQFYIHSGSWTPVTFDLATIPGFDITEWHQYVGVYDQTDPGNELKLYVDGVLRATAGKTGNIDSSGQPVFLGFDNTGGGRWFDGKLDEVAIYGYPLTPAQIMDHWQQAVPEPATCALLALGVLGLARRRRSPRR